MKKAILALLLVVSIVLSDSRAFAQDETTTTVEDLTTTTVETTTTTVAEPPAETTQEATTSTTTTTVKPVTYPRLPSLRVGSSRACRRGINACFIARHHQRHGHYLWRKGRVFQKPNGQLVRGSRNHTWIRMRRQAIALVRYLRIRRYRSNLVRRWSGVARCESTGRWYIATGNGYYGGLQFSLGTWRAYGGRGYPHHQPAWYQAQIADRVRTRSGLHHWPHCGRYYG